MENSRFKFRYWHNINKIMHSNKEHSVLAKNLCNEDSVWVVMQFTGLTDKNGKEIYEGDILSSSLTRHKAKVEYEAPSFIYRWDDGKVTTDRIGKSYDVVDIKIIGNIYENPELL